MIPQDFTLYDTLNCAATAIGEDASGRPREAEAAWLEACLAASGLFPPGTAAHAAVSVILAAARPGSPQPGRAALREALDAAALTALTAMDGDAGLCEQVLPAAFAAAALLTADIRGAVTVILAETRAAAWSVTA